MLRRLAVQRARQEGKRLLKACEEDRDRVFLRDDVTVSEAVAWTLKWRALGVDIPLVSPQALAIAIRKTQLNSPNCPPELKEKARLWLLERDFDTSIDD